MSSGCAGRSSSARSASACCAPSRSPASPVRISAVIAVTVAPGTMLFTRMWCGRSSAATERVRPSTAALAAEYTCAPTPPTTPAGLDVERITPLPCGIITAAACFMPSNVPRRMTAIVRSTSVMSSLAIEPTAPMMPALLNITSSRPNSATASSTAARTSASSVTSTRAKRASVAELAGEPRALFDQQVGDDDARSLLDEAPSRRRPDAAGTAGDDGAAPGQPATAHGSPSDVGDIAHPVLRSVRTSRTIVLSADARTVVADDDDVPVLAPSDHRVGRRR